MTFSSMLKIASIKSDFYYEIKSFEKLKLKQCQCHAKLQKMELDSD